MKTILTIISLIFLNLPLFANEITGIVADKESRSPIPYVSIGIINTPLGTYSSENGSFELSLDKLKDSDSLRFSCIGYFPQTFCISNFTKINVGLDTIFLTKKVTELNEVIISNSRLKKKKLGNKTSHKKIVFGYKKDMEGGIIIENDDKLILNKVSFKLTTDGQPEPDSAILRFNIYNINNKLPFENLLSQPIYFHLNSDQFNGTNEFDISKYNITVEESFAATFEIIKQYGGGQIYFAGWINGCPSVHRLGTQGKWVEARADKKKGQKGMKLHQSLVLEALVED